MQPAEDPFEQLGQLDSAVAYLTRVDGQPFQESRSLNYSFAHQRLIAPYSRMGRADDARREWCISSESFTRPNPTLVRLVEEARAALASAERRN
ncbi:MAG: hypothetical protein HYR48_08245 [Gemmatimonadetes bacterium]|nr:hypothetical protein [Gemmatimonadota bacterium]